MSDQAAVAASVQFGRVELGLAGFYRPDRWLSVLVELPGASDEIASVELVTSAVHGQTICHQLNLSGQGASRRAGAAILPGPFSDAEIIARNQREEIVLRQTLSPSQQDSHSMPRSLAADEDLFLIAGRLRGLDAVGAQLRSSSAGNVTADSIADRRVRPRFVPFDSAAAAMVMSATGPLDAALALDAASTIVVVDATSMSPSRAADFWKAIGAWVRRGGRLVLSLPATGISQELPAADDPITLLRLGTVSGQVELRQLSVLEAFAGATTSGNDNRNAASSLRAVRFKPVTGQVVATVADNADDIPLVVQIPHGLGEIVVTTFSLDAEALQNVPWRGRLLEQIVLPRAMQPASEKPGPAKPPTPAAWQGKGYTDLGEQLADALDRFEGAGPQTFCIFAGAALLLIALVGPLGWFIVRRRPQLVWPSFVGSIAAFCAVAYVGTMLLKNSAAQLRQIDFVDVDLTADADAQGPQLVARSIAAVYSPPQRDIAITIKPPWARNDRTDAARIALSPLRARDAQRFLISDRAGPHVAGDSIDQFDAPPWSSQTVNAVWSAPLIARDSIDNQSGGQLSRDAFAHAIGSLRNPLPVALRDATLFYGDSATPLGAIEPDQTVALDARNVWSSAEAHLNRRRLLQDRESAQVYDAASTDLARIGEIVSLYAAAGGKRYTHLDHRLVAQLDVSEALRRGQAILLATADVKAEIMYRSAPPQSAIAPTSQSANEELPLAPVAALERVSSVRILLPVSEKSP